MSTHEETLLTRLASRLLERSQERSVRWDKAPKDTYIAPFNQGSVVVRSLDADGAWPFELQLLDANGRIIASRRSLLDSEDDPLTQDEGEWNRLVYAVYSAARAAALNIDATVEALLGDLDAGRQPPKSDDDIPF